MNVWLLSAASIKAIILNLISSIIFGAIIWFSRKLWINKLIKGYYLQFDTEKIYPSNRKSNKLIDKEINSSNKICILAIRGKSFVDSDKSTCIYPSIWEDKNKTIEIIIANESNNVIGARSKANNIDIEDYKLSIKTLRESIKIRKTH